MPVLSSGFLSPLSTSALAQPGGAFVSSTEASAGRVNPATMFKYGQNTVGPSKVTYTNADYTDWRVRISLAPGANYFSNDANDVNVLLSPLSGPGNNNNNYGTYGVIFPYTPTMQIMHTATYQPQRLLHSNYTQYFYENSEVQAINITGDFTVQSIDEGQYLLAAIYFFRSLTKMFFGTGQLSGNPPPLVYLNGYGQYYLPNVPCVVTSFSHTMPAEVDYLEIPDPLTTQGIGTFTPGQNSTRLPTTSQINLSVQPVYSRLAQTHFSLTDFARGALINKAGAALPASSYGAASNNPATSPAQSGNGGFL